MSEDATTATRDELREAPAALIRALSTSAHGSDPIEPGEEA